jgi:hypothetical protein
LFIVLGTPRLASDKRVDSSMQPKKAQARSGPG